MKNCISCGKEIPELRLKVLPNSKTCVQCSNTGKVAGFPVITNKTSYSELQIVAQETATELYAKQDRKGSISTGVQFKNTNPPKTSNFE
ncbi:MAG TPA: TraR/DksA C4-type zinc finger protein [Cytophagaceae bacterium]|jgi:hypothetical protein|nr:TraR/DksA C4-type zinc finger protein [Cytophagaceae bacterium]